MNNMGCLLTAGIYQHSFNMIIQNKAGNMTHPPINIHSIMPANMELSLEKKINLVHFIEFLNHDRPSLLTDNQDFNVFLQHFQGLW